MGLVGPFERGLLAPAITSVLCPHFLPAILELILKYLPPFYLYPLTQPTRIESENTHMQRGEAGIALAGKKFTLIPEGQVLAFNKQHGRFQYFQLVDGILLLDCAQERRYKILKKVDGLFETVRSFAQDENGCVAAFAVDRHLVYIGFDNGLLLRFDMKSKSIRTFMFFSSVIALACPVKNRIFVVTKEAIYKLAPNLRLLKKVVSKQLGACFTKTILFVFNIKKTSVFALPSLRKQESFPDGRITAISANDDGTIAIVKDYESLQLYSSFPPWEPFATYKIGSSGVLDGNVIERCILSKDGLYLQGFNAGPIFCCRI